MEDDLWWKSTFVGRQTLVEEDLRWKMTLGGRQTSVEDNLWWKTTFGGTQPLMEDDLRLNMTFGGGPLLGTPPLDSCQQPTPIQNCYHLSQTETEIEYAILEIFMRHACAEKKTFFGKDD